MDKLEILVQLVDTCIVSLLKRLQPIVNDSSSHGKLTGATHKNPQGIILGYVSFSPHRNPEEETIDATLLIDLAKEVMSADICWSNGEIISDLGEYQIGHSSLNEVSQSTQMVYYHIEEEMFHKMAELIKSDMPSKDR
jgi:hypothetical protein